MSSQKVKAKVNRMYKSAKRDTKRIANSDKAHEIEAKAKETMIDAKDSAKRIMGSQDVRGKGNEMMHSARDFLGAVYNAARKESTKKAVPKENTKKAHKKMRRAQNLPKNRAKS
jgi:hypothetical protein